MYVRMYGVDIRGYADYISGIYESRYISMSGCISVCLSPSVSVRPHVRMYSRRICVRVYL